MSEKVFKEKRNFVELALTHLCKSINEEISCLEYVNDERNNEEYVIVHYYNGSKIMICVTGDSLKAIIYDVLKRV